MSRIKSNILYNLCYQILVLIVPLITAPYISRVLGAEGLGTYSYVSSVAYYFFILVTLGLTNYGNRSIAKCRDDKEKRSKTFWSIYSMQLLMGICITLLYAVYSIFLADPAYKTYFLIYTLYIVGACLDVNWFFFGMEKFKLTTIRNAIVKVLTVVLIFGLVRGDNALISYFCIVAGSTLFSNLFLWGKVHENVYFYKPKLKEILVHFKPNFILFLPILAMSIYRVMDKIMIKQLSGVVENGYYENADRIITISLTAFSAVATVMMPAISNMVANKKDESVQRMLFDMMQVVNCLSIAMVFGLMAIAEEFAPLFFGEEFAETGVLLVGLAPTIFMSGWKNVLRSQYLIPYEKDRAYVISLVAGAAVNIIVNSLFIPQYGARGAVIGTLMAEFVGFLIQTYVAGKDVSVKRLFTDSVIFLPSGLVMGLIVHWVLKILPYNLASVIGVIVLGGCIYLLLSFLSLFCFDRDRYKYFVNMLNVFTKRRKGDVNN